MTYDDECPEEYEDCDMRGMNGIINCEDGGRIVMRTLQSPEDFIKEALRDRKKSEKLMSKAMKRKAKYGEQDIQYVQFMYEAEALIASAEHHEDFSVIMEKYRREDE